MATFYTTSGVLGVDIDNVETVSIPQHALGTCVPGNDGTEWMFVQASTAITVNMTVGIDENFAARPITTADAQDGWNIGFAQVAFAANNFGWLAIKGSGANIDLRIAVNCAADVALYTSATAGILDDTSTSFEQIKGIVATESGTGTSVSTVGGILTFPRAATF
jgi:hypothetical protein